MGGAQHVVLVTSDHVLAASFEEAMTARGFSVSVTPTRLPPAPSVDLIVVDVGDEPLENAAARLRAMDVRARIGAVALVFARDGEAQREGEGEGERQRQRQRERDAKVATATAFSAYVEKPLSGSNLVAVVENLTRLRASA